jgi:N-acyl-D-amino-acid deacylase
MSLDLVIEGATVVDGSGAPRFRADVGVSGDRIDAVGDLSSVTAASRIDATGSVVSPGWVDLHSHSDLTVLSDGRARSSVRQGITTAVVGNCGMSPTPTGTGGIAAVRQAIGIIDMDPAVPWDWTSMAGYRAALTSSGIGLNIAPLAGHVALRVSVAGESADPLDARARRQLEDAADRELDEGAVGVSTGLMYPPAMSADGAELEALGRAVARHDAVFALHMRNYADRLVDAVDEALAVGRATGCRLQLSHLAVAGRRNWGSVARALERVDRARAEGLDVGVDIYPYLAGSANLSQLLPGWAQEGGSVAVTARLADPQVRARIREEWVTSLHFGWDEIRVSLVDDDLRDTVLGRTIEEAGAAMGLPADAAALELIARTEDRVQMVAFGRSEADLLSVLHHETAAIGSDGLALDPDGPTSAGRPHPRSYGCYPKLLGRVVREDGTLTLERAIQMATSVPAGRAHLTDRGAIREGAFADIVVFDPARVIDRATFDEPARFPEGIRHVIVNGVPVVTDGEQVEPARPGRVLAGGGSR